MAMLSNNGVKWFRPDLQASWGTTTCGHHMSAWPTYNRGQNGRHFPDDIFKCIFLNENAWISINISLKFVPKGPIDNISSLVKIMAWRLTYHNTKRQAIVWNNDGLVYWRVYMHHSFSMS